jgi:hypothetical protein
MHQSASVAGAAKPEQGKLSSPYSTPLGAESAKPVRGRPFERGRSGNPGGQPSLFKVYAAEFGDMSAVEVVELRRAVNLLRRAERADDNNAVRMVREARSWLDGIRARRAHQRELSPVTAFDQYVAEKAAAR